MAVLPAATGLAEDRDVARIAAEHGDVGADPFEREHQVSQPEVGAVGEALAGARDARQPQIRERVQPMRRRDDDHIVLSRELAPS
jgi:hypothetical protein